LDRGPMWQHDCYITPA